MKIILLLGFLMMAGTCCADIESNPSIHKRCKRQMAGCPGLQSGTGRCTGCHNGSGGVPTSKGCTGCSHGGTSSGTRRWSASYPGSSYYNQNYYWWPSYYYNKWWNTYSPYRYWYGGRIGDRQSAYQPQHLNTHTGHFIGTRNGYGAQYAKPQNYYF